MHCVWLCTSVYILLTSVLFSDVTLLSEVSLQCHAKAFDVISTGHHLYSCTTCNTVYRHQSHNSVCMYRMTEQQDKMYGELHNMVCMMHIYMYIWNYGAKQICFFHFCREMQVNSNCVFTRSGSSLASMERVGMPWYQSAERFRCISTDRVMGSRRLRWHEDGLFSSLSHTDLHIHTQYRQLIMHTHLYIVRTSLDWTPRDPTGFFLCQIQPLDIHQPSIYKHKPTL